MSDQPHGLAGRIALVTGASSGIGQAIARLLAVNGVRVVCTARDPARLDSFAAQMGECVLAHSLDVTDADSAASVKDRLPPDWREVSVLVNNAGQDVGGRRAFHEGDVEQWAQIVDTNVTGMIRVTRALIDGMRESDCGHIVNIGSTSGVQPYATGSIYSASKHAVHGFSESLRLDYAGTGIRVTEILPGMVRTGFAAARWGDAAKAEEFYDSFGTCLSPDDVARSVLFALEQPPHVVISHLTVVPFGQG